MAVNKKTGAMKSPVRMGRMMVKNLTVKWSHLLKPDLEYNSGHSVTVEMNKELAKLQKEMIAQTGVKKINGLKDDDGTKLASFRNKIHSNEGIERFPRIYDEDGQHTGDCPFGGDVVNVVIKPKVWDMNGTQSISCYLEEIQWVKKNSGDAVTFEVINDKADEVSFANDNLEDDKLPF
jgi:hypothetical protein